MEHDKLKSDISRLNREYDEIISTIPPKKVKEIYSRMVHEQYRSLWIDKDPDKFKKKVKNITDFIDRLSSNMPNDLLLEDIKAYNQICYELSNEIRKEEIEQIDTVTRYLFLFYIITYFLERFSQSNDKKHVQMALNLSSSISQHLNDEYLDKISLYCERQNNNVDLTSDEIESLKNLENAFQDYKTLKKKQRMNVFKK